MKRGISASWTVLAGLAAASVGLGGCTEGVGRPVVRYAAPQEGDRGGWALVGPSEAMTADPGVLSEYNWESSRRDAVVQAGKWDAPVHVALYDVDSQPSLSNPRRIWFSRDPYVYTDFARPGESTYNWDTGYWWVR